MQRMLISSYTMTGFYYFKTSPHKITASASSVRVLFYLFIPSSVILTAYLFVYLSHANSVLSSSSSISLYTTYY